MAKVELYSSGFCFYCVMAERMLREKGAEFTIYRVDEDMSLRDEMVERAQRHSVPQIFINNQHIGGYTDMVALDRDGGLDPMLATDG